jgi:hypothetical protein
VHGSFLSVGLGPPFKFLDRCAQVPSLTVADERNAIERRSYQGIAETIV